LSRGPLLAIESAGRSRATIVGLKMGAGQLAASKRQVAVLVRSERFLETYRRITDGDVRSFDP